MDSLLFEHHLFFDQEIYDNAQQKFENSNFYWMDLYDCILVTYGIFNCNT